MCVLHLPGGLAAGERLSWREPAGWLEVAPRLAADHGQAGSVLGAADEAYAVAFLLLGEGAHLPGGPGGGAA